MKRLLSLFVVCVLAASALLLGACVRQDGLTHVPRGSQPEDAQSEPSAPEVSVSSVEIACWGDSMTFGYGASDARINAGGRIYDASNKGYPEVLQDLSGIKTYNFGVVGASSKEIVSMQGGLVVRDNPELSVSRVEQVVKESRVHRGNILIIEMGSNGGWENYDQLISQYREMITYARCDKYIIVGDTDDPELSADPAQQAFDEGSEGRETAWEGALREAFGEHFLNMRLCLIARGLSDAGLTATPEDVSAASRGCVSQQLRSDWTHFNSYGYYAQAVEIYQHGLVLGYW